MDWQTRVREALPVVTGDFSRDHEIQEELASHCAAREAELRQAGVTPAEAERRVLDELQSTARQRRALARTASPSSPGDAAGLTPVAVRWIRQSWQDVRYAARLLVRTPAATLAAVATLALTIGATTAIFSFVQAVLLRPLPYPDADRLVRVWEASPQGDLRNVVSSGNYLAWGERSASFESLAAYRPSFDIALTGSDGPPEKLSAAMISPAVLDVLQVGPAVGPGFQPGQMSTGQPREVLLSAAFWQSRFDGDADVVGRVLTLDGLQATVAGVLPDGFRFPDPDIDVWVSQRFASADRDSWRSHNYNVIGRLADEVDIEQAQAELTTVAGTLAVEHPADMTGWGVNIVPAHADTVRDVRPLLLVLMGVVGVVLLIACANLATLQIARASRRNLEMAVRSAIGAGRGRLVRQLLTESLMVALAGGALGAVVLAVSLKAIVLAAPSDIPFLENVTFDSTALGFTAAVSLVCALLVGLAPALLVSRTDVRALLQAARAKVGGSETRLRHALVAAQIGLALVLLVSAGLLVQSFWKLQAVDHGFDPDHVLTVSLDLPQARYGDNAAQVAFYNGLLGRLRTVPGVTAAAGTTSAPAAGAGMTFSFAIDGRPSTNPTGREDPMPLQGITPGYFETMRIPVLDGRAIDASDGPDSAGAVVINHALAMKYWPDGGAVGTRIRFRENQPWYEVVGVVGDTHDEGLDVPPPPTIYLSLAQRNASWAWMTWQTLVIRTANDPMSVLPSVRDTIWEFDSNLPLLDAATMDAAFRENDARRRFATTLLGAFALLALGLGAIGVFGVLSCAMAERRQEIGIRLALGAEPARVATAMIRAALTWALAGAAIGAVAALAVTRFLQTLLFDVEPTDPLTFAAMTILLLAVAVLAAWLPARRAVRLSPVTALREG